MSRSNLIDLSVQFQHQTEGAVCIRETEEGEDIWVPKFRCQIEPSQPSRGQMITLTTDEGTVTEKGLV
ncbi:MAG: hypothetical protein AAFQ58_19055 [Pseudomonadota bacterium]